MPRCQRYAEGMLLHLLAAAAQASPPDLTGDWAITLNVVVSAKLPMFGPTNVTSTTTMLAHIDGQQQSHITCRVEPTSPLRMVTTIIPDSFVQTIGVKHYTMSIDEDGRYEADFGPQHIAYDPAQSDGPPAEIDHVAVYDWEGDGNPGATILLEAPLFGNSEVYITQLAHTRMVGQVVDADTIAGGVDIIAMVQRSIGARPAMFASNPEATPLPEESNFEMRRVAPGTTCADL